MENLVIGQTPGEKKNISNSTQQLNSSSNNSSIREGQPCCCHHSEPLLGLPQRLIRRTSSAASGTSCPTSRQLAAEPVALRKHSLAERRQLYRPHSGSLPHIHLPDPASALATVCHNKPPSGLVSRPQSISPASAPANSGSSGKDQPPVFRIGGKTRFSFQHEHARFFVSLHEEERSRSTTAPSIDAELSSLLTSLRSSPRRHRKAQGIQGLVHQRWGYRRLTQFFKTQNIHSSILRQSMPRRFSPGLERRKLSPVRTAQGLYWTSFHT